jgi:hypothetical protein
MCLFMKCLHPDLLLRKDISQKLVAIFSYTLLIDFSFLHCYDYCVISSTLASGVLNFEYEYA